jgi:hypothetical protein
MATKNAFQEKKNRAAIAATWNMPMKIEVTQLISPLFFDFFFKTSSDRVMGASGWFFVVSATSSD